MNKGNKFLILLISLFIINFLNSYNISENFNNDKISVFAQETAAGQFSTYTNEKYGITMQYPSDWTKTEGESKVEDLEVEIVTFEKDITDYKGDVSLYFVPNQSISLQEYLSSTIEIYEEAYEDSDFELLSSNATTGKTLSGNPAYALEYEYEFTDSNTKYLELGAKIGNNYYYVEYSAEEGNHYDESLPIAQKMMDSIKIGNAATSTSTSPQPQQPQPPTTSAETTDNDTGLVGLLQESPTQLQLQQQQQQQPEPQQPQPQITIPKANTPPTAMNSSFITIQNDPIDIPLEIHDNEGDMLDISVVEAPKFGELTIKDANTKTLTYTPNSNYVGYDSFIFEGKDRNNASSNKATVSITIASLPSPSSQPNVSADTTTEDDKLTSSSKAGSQDNVTNSNITTTITIPPPTPPQSSTNTTNQNLNNNLNQQKLVDQIASTISIANNIDKNKVIQVLNDLIETTKAKGGNVIESLKKIADVISKDPSGVAANKIVNAANRK